MGRDSMISIENLSWSYHEETPILSHIAASIDKNTFTTILGPNGSGKTTLLKQILRILPVAKKTIYLNEEDITVLNRQELSQEIGMVPQNERNPYQFSVEDMIKLGRYTHRKQDSGNIEGSNKVIDNVMKLTSITHLKDHLITELSGGEYQRVIIARALAQEPKILALDEPTTYLDPKHQLDILKLLRELILTEDLTVICILHDLNSALSFSDQVILLHEGEVYGHGAPEEMLTTENLKAVYGIDTARITNPFTNKPFIISDTRS